MNCCVSIVTLNAKKILVNVKKEHSAKALNRTFKSKADRNPKSLTSALLARPQERRQNSPKSLC